MRRRIYNLTTTHKNTFLSPTQGRIQSRNQNGRSTLIMIDPMRTRRLNRRFIFR